MWHPWPGGVGRVGTCTHPAEEEGEEGKSSAASAHAVRAPGARCGKSRQSWEHLGGADHVSFVRALPRTPRSAPKGEGLLPGKADMGASLLVWPGVPVPLGASGCPRPSWCIWVSLSLLVRPGGSLPPRDHRRPHRGVPPASTPAFCQRGLRDWRSVFKLRFKERQEEGTQANDCLTNLVVILNHVCFSVYF